MGHALAYHQPQYFTGGMPLPTISHSILQGACPCLPSATVFYKGHPIAYHQPQYFTGGIPLPTISHSIIQGHPFAYHQPQYYTGASHCLQSATVLYRGIPLPTISHSILQGVCPCLPSATVFHKGHALAYHQPQHSTRGMP